MARSSRPEQKEAGPTLFIAILLLVFAGILAGCDLFSSIEGAGAKIILGSAEVPSGGTAKVKVAVDIPSGAKEARLLAEIQVGPSQALRFDPRVIQIKGITGIGEFTVLATDIDKEKGEARFAAVSISGGVAQGEILEIEVEALGRAGEMSELKLTGVDLLQDRTGKEIAPVTIINGRIRIK
jgi:hypothetical protein